ncbi:response regulator transcription factor [Sediminibacterium sp. WSJ-3]|nr:response regulator transcription factor [Sediminibacterium soli]
MRSGIALLLKNHYPHATVTEVSDGAELLREAVRGTWDLIISDISMPGRTGAELVKELYQLVPGVPILMLSSYPAEQYALRTLKMGASGYLTKQASTEELIKAVESLLSGKKYITPEVADILASSLSVHDDRPLHEQLSEREYEVFKYLSHGSSVSEIAETLSLSVHTISTYRTRLLQKLALQNNADLVRYAIEHNLFQSI